MITFAVIVVAAAIMWAAHRIAIEIRAAREDGRHTRALAILHLLAPGMDAAQRDPRALLTWHPIAQTLRRLLPGDCELLDKAAGAPFPFTPAQIEAAHARWTSDWLAWERAHDAEYKDRAAVAEQEFAASGGAAAARAKQDGIEREKLDLYQRHYQEYVQVAKALQALSAPATGERPPSGGGHSGA